MGKSKAPPPPDPQVTAGAQTAQNIGTAIAQGTLNNVNQVTPDGSLTYSQTGSQEWRDPNTGRVYQLPQYTATQTLSENQQAIKDQQDAADLNLATIGNEQSGRIGDILGTPFEYNPDTHMTWATGLYDDINGSTLARQQDDLRTQLSQQGIKIGSQAYDRAMEGLRTSQGNSRNDFMLDSYGQGMQTALTERNQPINETSALLSGSQVSMPQFVPTNPAQVANVDVAGLTNDAYRAEVANVNARNQYNSNIMGGLFGLGAGGLTGGYF
ncbi:hypothetical protein [uncultured Roseobacter sp.]|uniref:hypothetical protein n=1 Tax=uncultured Roseobacter sp. TaxID=114847 RepID=UPI00262C7A15|nr:hypothetical protein [uncultured Roseobacter sp.]